MSNHKKFLIPRLSLRGIHKNGSTYVPYIGVSIFAVFTYFVFDLIIKNDIINTLPKAVYISMLLQIGFVLLSIIMIPFLMYTNGFLIKRRKKELGLYSMLGMEKKHIGMMMVFETIIIFAIVCACAIILGLVFSKFLFLVLLNLAKMNVDVAFQISGKAIKDTLIFYGVISLLNLFTNLLEVGKANPIELMSQSKKGEKQPRFILLWTFLGLAITGWGYYMAITSQIDQMIFMNFFGAVLLVIIGTYLLFTSGSIFFINRARKNTKVYYKATHFITISGMLYRMKKNAASLSNICIFATMSIITVVCTVSLYLGTPEMMRFIYPYQVEHTFLNKDFTDRETWEAQVTQFANDNSVTITEHKAYEYIDLRIELKGNEILDADRSNYFWEFLKFMTLDTYNDLEGTTETLEEDEVFLFTTGPDMNLNTINFKDKSFVVKKEFQSSSLAEKSQENSYQMDYMVIMPNEEALYDIVQRYQVDGRENLLFKEAMNIEGEEQNIQAFHNQMEELSKSTPGLNGIADIWRIGDMEAMLGGLLFIGIFFGSIFFLCLLIIMYYKQISEGFEDQKKFEIMQKVGMSDEEVKKTIRKQILMVFFLPLIGALIHTAIGMNMVMKLMGVILLFNKTLMIGSAVGVGIIFTILYIFCYNKTAKAYYRIVRKMIV